jgi:mannitol-1-phosphate 5-dehydrogenase
MQDAWIVSVARSAMMESAQALSKNYGVPMKELTEHVEDLLVRFANPHLGDTVERVGKDTIRKLSHNDRLIGAAELCMETGDSSIYIPIAIGAALLFAPVGDQAAQTVKQAADVDSMAALKEFSGVTGQEPFAARAVKYRELLLKKDYNGILELVKML